MSDIVGSTVPNAVLELNNVVAQVRLYLRDYAELNRLIRGEESSNRQIIWAIMDTLDDFNTTPPFTQFSLSNFPSRGLFIRGVACSLLESIGLLQTRNHLNFSDGGIQVGVSDKTPFIQSWLSVLRTAYEEKKMRLKVAYNIETAWGGGIFSEYRLANTFYGAW